MKSGIFEVRVSREALRLAERYGYLPYMVERYINIFGDLAEVVEFLEANEEPMPETFRCNSHLIDCGELVERLESKGFTVERIPFTSHGFEALESPISLGATHEYLMGYYYIQDPASMLPVQVLDPRPGEFIIDMAAAPGGKATQILQVTGDQARLLAVDSSKTRLRALRSHMQRMGFRNYVAVRLDARRLPEGLIADRILLDAPCSGEGVIRKDPSRKTSRTLQDLIFLSDLQASLLDSALNHVKPGGVVVYATCSVGVEENEYVVNSILEKRGDFTVEPIDSIPGAPGVTEYMHVRFDSSLKRCRRLYPHLHGTEGFTICLLRKRG